MPEPSAPHFRRTPFRALLALWIVALLILLAGLGNPVVQRTQEARVLETAREMRVSNDPAQWIVPKVNGEVRLNKPPLAYWLAAASFGPLGVTDFAGRLPFALAGWLTLAVVYRFGRDLLGHTYGLLAAAVLLSSYMFYRHSRLAETDGLASFFLTAAIYGLWKGALAHGPVRAGIAYHLAAVALGLAVMAKGPPAAFGLLFFLAWVAVERRRHAVPRLLLSGALLTAVAIGGAWFFIIRTSPEFHVIADELRVVTGGEDHRKWFFVYIPQILLAAMPWTGLMIVGIAFAVRRWRVEPAGRVMLLWAASIIVPLCFLGNKQNHYLVPLGPPMAMLAAYAIHRAVAAAKSTAMDAATLERGAREANGVRLTFLATVAISALSPVAVYLLARQQRGLVQSIDLVLIVLILAVTIGVGSVTRRQGLGPAALAYAAGVALSLAVALGRWLPSLDAVTHRSLAADLRQAYGAGPYAFYGSSSNVSLPLVWNLKEIVQVCEDPSELHAWLGVLPRGIVIAQTKNDRQPPPIPADLRERAKYPVGHDGMNFRIYARNE